MVSVDGFTDEVCNGEIVESQSDDLPNQGDQELIFGNMISGAAVGLKNGNVIGSIIAFMFDRSGQGYASVGMTIFDFY